ncbi:hypothetical protein AMTR_s00287p00013320 [Amborella trichopoda]|uniref:Uncharacterized protein n=1 Tax=Amborella trichopoda TaxID=13333 RepID=W1PV40_AMBTC|nr:hypothetical protein AMTR_s00287p00013320 [Amborella trichopoda]
MRGIAVRRERERGKAKAGRKGRGWGSSVSRPRVVGDGAAVRDARGCKLAEMEQRWRPRDQVQGNEE